jgi:hypothetical protein
MGKKTKTEVDIIKDYLEDFNIENSPSIRKKILKAEEDLKASRVISLDKYLSTQKR